MPKYAIIDCEDEPKWDDEGPDDLWKRQLEEHGAGRDMETWVTYRAYKGEIPTREDGLDGVIIPGSHYSVYENLDLKAYVRDCYMPWTANWADPVHAWKPWVVGSCFGHQLIAEAMGGHVCPNPRGKYIVKAEELFPTEAFCRMPWADSIVLKTKEGPMIQVNEIAWSSNVEAGVLPFMRITETHGDSVVTLPADSQVLAMSDSSTNELFLVGRNLLAFQSHPEFTWESQLLTKVIPYVYPERMDDEERLAADESFAKPLHSEALIEITRRFIKGDYFERPKQSQLPGEMYTCEADAEASRYNVPEGYPEEVIGGEVVGGACDVEGEGEDKGVGVCVEEGTGVQGIQTATRYPGSAHIEREAVEPLASGSGAAAGFAPSMADVDILQPSPSRRLYHTPSGRCMDAPSRGGVGPPSRSPGQRTGEEEGEEGEEASPHTRTRVEDEEVDAPFPPGGLWSILSRLTSLGKPERIGTK